MSITGGIKFFERNKCLLADGGTASATSGEVVQDFLIDTNPITYWNSVDSTDLVTETIELTFNEAEIDRIFIVDHNWKDFTVKYWNGSSYANFSSVVGLDGYRDAMTLTGSAGLAVSVVGGIRGQTSGTVTVTIGSVVEGGTVIINGVTFTALKSYEDTRIVAIANTASVLSGTYFDVYEGASPGTPVRIWFTTSGVGSAPSTPSGGRLLNVDLLNGDTAIQVAGKIRSAIDADTSGGLTQGGGGTATVAIFNRTAGNVTDASVGTSGFSISSITNGRTLAATEFNRTNGSASTAASLAAQVNAYFDDLTASAPSNVVTLTGDGPSTDTNYYEVAAVTTDALQITVTTTQTANEEKTCAQIIATKELGTLQGYPKINNLKHSRNIITGEMLSGKSRIVKGYESMTCKLKFDNYPASYEDDLDLMFTLFDSQNPFLMWFCGGRYGSDYFRYELKGFRLKDVYQCQIKGDIPVSYYKNIYVSSIDLEVQIDEHV